MAKNSSSKPDVTDQKLVDELNEALRMEYQAALQYRQHYNNVRTDKRDMLDHFLEHEDDEHKHAKMLADHIQAMGAQATTEHEPVAEFTDDLHAAMRQDAEGERAAIVDYKDLLELCDRLDAVETRLLIEGILTDETEHLNDLSDALREDSRKAGAFNFRTLRG